MSGFKAPPLSTNLLCCAMPCSGGVAVPVGPRERATNGTPRFMPPATPVSWEPSNTGDWVQNKSSNY